MFTTENEMKNITDWDGLSKVLYSEGIDTQAMTADEQQEAMEVWAQDRTRYLDDRFNDKEMDDTSTMLQLLHHFGQIRVREVPVFRPLCGSSNIYEVCLSSSYFDVRAVRRGGVAFLTVADRQERQPAGVGEPEAFRCDECEFETESEEYLMRHCLRGGPVDGRVTIDGGVRVELLGPAARSPRQSWIAAISYFHPDAPEGWVEVIGGGIGRVTLPITESGDPQTREAAMRELADEVEGVLRHLGQPGRTLEQLNSDGQMEIGEALASIELRIAESRSVRS